MDGTLTLATSSGIVDGGRTVAALLADWLAGLGASTRIAYGKDLRYFAAFVGAADSRQAAERLCADSLLARDVVLRWKTAMRDGGLAPATINRRLTCVRSLYKHIVGAALVVPSMKGVSRRRKVNGNGGTLPALLTAAAAGEGLRGLRDVALLLLLHDSGLRRAEAASLRVADLDIEARKVHAIAKGAQGERVAVDVSGPAVAALRAYLDARGTLPADAPLFASCDRARKGTGGLTADGIHSLLHALAGRAGLAHVAPHDLRRHGATALAVAGADVESLRRWGRWSDFKMPARYVLEVEAKARKAVDMLAGLRAVAG